MKKISTIYVLILTLTFVFFAVSSVQAQGQLSQVIPGQFIVVLNDVVEDPGTVAQEIAAQHGLILRHVYSVAT